MYGSDRVFVAVTLAGEEDRDATARLDALGAAGHPVVRLAVRDRYDLGGELARWEFAAAVAGAVMHGTLLGGPNVAASEQETGRVLAERPALTRPASRETLDAFLAGIPRGHYLAILAYLQPSAEDERRLAAIRLALRDRLRVATTVGYGPRYLHSTGQLHKAGPPTGHFLQIVDPAADDIPVPGEPFTFGELKVTQAEGDLLALERCGRPVVRIEGMDLLEP